MSGFILDRAEFLALMTVAQANDVIGLDLEALAPTDMEQYQALVDAGLLSLRERGAVTMEGDAAVLDADVLSMAVLIAHPEAAIVTTRIVPGEGQQLFLHYLADDVVMEQTLPSELEHRWALVPNRTVLVERILGILPVRESAPTTQLNVTIDQDEYVTAQTMVQAGNTDGARTKLIAHGFSADEADQVIDALGAPEFAGTVAVLRCQDDEVVEIRNLAVVQGETIALLFKQVLPAPGEPAFEVTACDAGAVSKLATEWIYELSNSAN